MKFNIMVVATLFFAITAGAVYNGVVPTNEPIVVTDWFIVQVSEGANVIPPETKVKMSRFEVPELDTLCAENDVSFIEPLFAGADPNYEIDLSRFYRVHFNTPKTDADAVFDVIHQFEKSSLVESAENDAFHFVAYTPNDTYFSQQWGMKGTWGVRADDAWDIDTGSSSVVIAIADTGVDYDHPDLNDDIWINTGDNDSNGVDDDLNGYVDDWCGWDWVISGLGYTPWSGEDASTEDNDPKDFNGHGTHCSGIAAAETNNGVGVAGLGHDITIMALRVGLSINYYGTEYGIVGMSWCAEAMEYAADMGAVAFNASWGSSNSGGISSAAAYAASNGCQVITAAGNDSLSSAPYLGTRSDVIAVASNTSSGKKSSFSNYGSWVDVTAPGSNIYSTYQYHGGSHTYASINGTSMSAPHVVGLAGLCKSYVPSASRQDIRDAIEDGCRSLNNDSYDNSGLMGEGLIDAEATLNILGGVSTDNGNPSNPTIYALSSAYPNPSNGNATIEYALPSASDISLELFDIKGRKIDTLVSGKKESGTHTVDVTGLSSGIYLYKLTADEFTTSKKMVVTK